MALPEHEAVSVIRGRRTSVDRFTATTTDDDPTTAASSARRGPTIPSPTSPGGRSSGNPFWGLINEYERAA